ncbi:MAG: hypothetical protein ACFFCP_05850, partial [Promethearchaeota archaeon]
MLSAISLTIYEYRKYLVLSLVISLIAIPIADVLVIQRDRNRNEMYGEAFWIYGFEVYNMNDTVLVEKINELHPEWHFNDSEHVLPNYLTNVSYEYPVFGLFFFAIATWLFPGAGYLQQLWINFLLVLVFNLNLVLLVILLREKIKSESWARMFFAGYFVYGLIMSAGGGKLEPIVDCLLLMAIVLWKEQQHGKSMFALGLGVQTKIYPAVVFPLFFLGNPVSSVWFLMSMILSVIPTLFGASFESLVSHFLNTSEYSVYIVNPLYPGLALATPEFSGSTVTYYTWIPALIPLIIYVFYMLNTIRPYFPSKNDFQGKSLRHKLLELKPLYLYLLPCILFMFRWVMPWYLFWLGIVVVLFDKNEHALGYVKQITVVGLVYTLGLLCNWPYFIAGPLPDFFEHFPLQWWMT